MGIDEAKAAGAVALFGEKYGDVVRVVSVGTEDKPFSRELCGGTHARNTAELGFFKIVSESSVGSNARRIEAVTSAGALEYVDERLAEMDEVAAALKCRPADVMARVEQLKDEKSEAEKKLKAALVGGSSNQVADAVGSAVDMGAYKLVVAHLNGISGKELRNVWDTVRDKIGSDCACVLASEADGKVGLLAAATDGAVSAGFSAGNVVKEISGLVGGKGGGRPNMAQAGGKDAAGIDAALDAAKKLLGA
jgi:alanyl-tRNA synthetase